MRTVRALAPNPIFDVRGRRVLILGLGLHGGGEAAVRWALRHGAVVRVSDRKSASALASTVRRLRSRAITWHLGQQTSADIRWADVVIVNPGVPADGPEVRLARRLKKVVANEATIFLAGCPAPVIAVTGTRGKTTVTHLIASMVKSTGRRVVVSGNVRQVAMLDYLDRLRPIDLVVLELSSFQLELLPTIRRAPWVAVVTNILVDHLNRHGTMAKYGSVKANLVRYQQAGDVAVLNYDNAFVRSFRRLGGGRVVWTTMADPPSGHRFQFEGDWLVERRGRTVRRILSKRDIRLPGEHQLQNVLAASAAARTVGVQPAAIRSAVRSFRGVPYRQELIRNWRGHRWINDTTATTPDGTLAALTVEPEALLIVGGTDKQLDFRRLAEELTARSTRLVVLPGTASDQLMVALRKAGYRGQAIAVRSLAEAVRVAARVIRPNQAVVFSPAAASFGLFAHEFDRGDQFTNAVRRLP